MESEIRPLSVIYCWQSMILAAVVAVSTGIIKSGIDISMGGKENRKKHKWLSNIVLPLVPLLLGASIANLVAIQPEAIVNHVEALRAKHLPIKAWRLYALYGACVGTFSDYIYTRIMNVLKMKIKEEA